MMLSTLIKTFQFPPEIVDRMMKVLYKTDIIFQYGSLLITKLDEDDYFVDAVTVKFGWVDFHENHRIPNNGQRPSLYHWNHPFLLEILGIEPRSDDHQKLKKMAQVNDFFFKSRNRKNYIVTCAGNYASNSQNGLLSLHKVYFDEERSCFSVSSKFPLPVDRSLDFIPKVKEPQALIDYKKQLASFCKESKLKLTVKTYEGNKSCFRVEVFIQGRVLGVSIAKDKAGAIQLACRQAIANVHYEHTPSSPCSYSSNQ